MQKCFKSLFPGLFFNSLAEQTPFTQSTVEENPTKIRLYQLHDTLFGPLRGEMLRMKYFNTFLYNLTLLSNKLSHAWVNYQSIVQDKHLKSKHFGIVRHFSHIHAVVLT